MWPKATPLTSITFESAATALIDIWFSCSVTLLTVTTNLSHQFEASLFNDLFNLCGTYHLRTTSYNPASSVMIEHMYWSLKCIITCHKEPRTDTLALVQLGLRTALKDYTSCSPAQLIFGEQLRVPRDSITPSPAEILGDQPNFL
ncbi:uncharacterized protein LOC124712276 [Schistocerca piceifrons]|uniref:uncharacterized protein LOC124712276 n=1 Tax=Schistocerca piceifrons TaxID=274613 RepID=UPI001F5FEF87|nr:uncharacterized protein LOC124712276 [Schistocerca piceifrons]